MLILQFDIDGSILPCKISCTTISNPFKEHFHPPTNTMNTYRYALLILESGCKSTPF